MQKLLLTDLDNTLYDRDAAFNAWAANFLAQQHVHDIHLLRWMIMTDEAGYARREEVFRLVRERLQLPDSVDDLVASYRTQFPAYAHATDETLEALRRLRQGGWKIGVVTNGDATAQRAKLKAAGLADLVDGIAISSEHGVRKPDPELFNIAATRCGLDLPARGWMIGDNPDLDIVPGQKLGLKTVWLSSGRKWPLNQLTPTYTARSVAEAVALIAG